MEVMMSRVVLIQRERRRREETEKENHRYDNSFLHVSKIRQMVYATCTIISMRINTVCPVNSLSDLP